MSKTEKELLHDLILNEHKLDVLKSRLSKFNPLKVLGVQNFEIRHSNVLAWLLDPAGNHSMDDRFFKKFILQTILTGDNTERLPESFDLIKFRNSRYFDLQVFREWKNIDLLLVSESQRLIVIIENKVYSKEHDKQLETYLERVNSAFNRSGENYFILPVFLTLYGDEPSIGSYLVSTYEHIIKILSDIVELEGRRLSAEIIVFINQYVEVLKERFGMDDEVRKLCLEFYKEYQEAIDLIYSVGSSVDIGDALIKFGSEHPELNIYGKKSRMVWFNVKEISAAKRMNTSWGDNCLASFWIAITNSNALRMTLEVGPFDDGNERKEFVRKLIGNGCKIDSRALRDDSRYTRICSLIETVDDWSDKEAVSNVMSNLYNNSKMKLALTRLKAAIKEMNFSKADE